MEEQKVERGFMKNIYKFPYKHSYGRWWLMSQDIHFFRGKERIYGDQPEIPKEFAETIWRDMKVKPRIYVGEMEKSPHVYSIKDYDYLKTLGYQIKRKKSERVKFGGKGTLRIEFSLVKYPSPSKNVSKTMPENHHVDYDKTYGWIKVVGKYSDNKPVYIDKRKEKKKELNIKALTEMALGIYKEEEHKTNYPLYLKELVIGISEDEHKLVTIPLKRDPPRFGFTGLTGGGKTISMHAVLCMLRHQMGIPWMHLDDEKSEVLKWSELYAEKENDLFWKRLEFFGLRPKPSPCIYFSPNIGEYSKEKESKLELNNESMHYFISMDWENIIDNFNMYFSEYPEMKMGISRRFINMGRLKKCRSPEEVYDLIINLRDEDLGEEVPIKTKYKLKSMFENLFSHNLINIDSGVPSKITYKKIRDGKQILESRELNPFIASVYAGLCPVLQIEKLKEVQFGDTHILPAYIKSIVRQIIDFKKRDELLKDKTFYIAIDELEFITREGVNNPIIDLAALGRSEGIGFAWANQSYATSGIPEQVKHNTHYLFVTKPLNNEDIKEIMKDFYDKYKHIEDVVKNLGIGKEKFECMIFHREPLITYDLDNGERKIVDRRPMKVTMIPPLGNHKEPPKIM